MAKRKTRVDQLPGQIKQTQENDDLQQDVIGESEPETIVVEESSTATTTKVKLDIPVFAFDGYARRRVDVTFTSAEALGWKAVLLGLEKQEAKLTNGKNVASVSDAVRWVGEQVKAGM